jgi:GT2 family glycosyltransferase
MLALCIERLQSDVQHGIEIAYEIIVSDDGNGHDVAAICNEKFPDVEYTQGPQQGPAANRNHGASLAKGTWLIFIDDDCIPQPGLLAAYRDATERFPESLAFEGAIFADHPEKLDKELAVCPVNTTGGNFWSANIAIQANLFRQLGGFDEQFKIAAQEDQDFYIRLQSCTTIKFIPGAAVIHPVRFLAFDEAKRKIKAQIDNYMKFALKHKAHFGYKNKSQIYFQRGILFQARATYGHLKKGNFISAKLSAAHFFAYLKRWVVLNVGLKKS